MTVEQWEKLKAFLEANKIQYTLRVVSTSKRGKWYVVGLPTIHTMGFLEDSNGEVVW